MLIILIHTYLLIQEYTYLDQKITDSSKEAEIKRRISFGYQAFGKASFILKPQMPIPMKKKVLTNASCYYHLWDRNLEPHKEINIKK